MYSMYSMYSPQPLSYDGVVQAANDEETLDDAMIEFYSLARTEWSAIAGQNLTYSKARFKWEAPMRHKAQPWSGSSALSVLWRSLAKRACEILVVLGRLDTSAARSRVVVAHVLAAAKAHSTLANSIRSAVAPQVEAWAGALHSAVQASSSCWVNSLKVLAEIKAKKLEAVTARCRRKEWKDAVSRPSPDAKVLGGRRN